ncbi:hypothetical protein B0H13DRAFT_2362567 [Mycena leptocephala]|nr:hypothetical protein B0H13DRAFT_2362567 [Mycena leptocephala]
MYKANKTSKYVPTLNAEDRQAIRAQVRVADASGSNRQNKHAQIIHMKEVTDRNTKRDAIRKERAEKAREILAKTTAIASVEDLDAAFQIGRGAAGYLTVIDLDLQLDWHVANAVKELASSQETSASGIPKAKSGANGRGNRENRYSYLREAISRRAEILTHVSAGPGSTIDQAVPEELTARPKARPMDVDDGGLDSEDEWYGS